MGFGIDGEALTADQSRRHARAIQARSAMSLPARDIFKSPDASLHLLALTDDMREPCFDVARPAQ